MMFIFCSYILFLDFFCYRMFVYSIFFFFFSSRRRHTRCLSDWSSDVCSSDLSCEGFEALIELAQDVDPETAELYRTQILPDEYRHAAIGRKALSLLADTPAAQERARTACREMNEKIFAAYRAHRARVDRGA